jgi:protoporphyrinogen/coproporphyrinogen III oxidase
MAQRVVVVGGGIAGLSVAWELLTRPGILPPDATIEVLEASERPGGNIRSERHDGFLCEWGPNGFLDDAPATIDACTRVGLAPRLVRASLAAERRFIVRGGKLRELPGGPVGFFTSNLLSIPGRLRVLGEPFIGPRRSEEDESVLDFARRRIGREAAYVLVDALVTGIWAGDGEKLSLRSTLTKLYDLEREHGGLVRGMLARRGKGGGPAGPRGRLTSFPDGLAELPAALASALGARVRTGVRATALERLPQGGYRVHVEGGAAVEADRVVVASPCWHAGPLLGSLDAELGRLVGGIPSVPVAVLHLGFAQEDAAGLAGFGFLIPRGESKSLLGVLLPSNIFPGRAPEGRLLATAMLGGARDPGAIDRSDAALIDEATGALAALAGVRKPPTFSLLIRHTRAIPQYVLGHAARLAAIEARRRTLPGLHLAGNSYRGVAINACLLDAPKVAAELA